MADDEDEDAPLLNERVQMSEDDDAGDSDSSEKDEQDSDAPQQPEQQDEEFKEVKLCTKHAAFLRSRPDQGYFLHFATQNARKQQSVER